MNRILLVENENHCDFVKLREMLIRTNMEDMRETTHKRHYELFRRNKLQEMGFSDSESKRYAKLLYILINAFQIQSNSILENKFSFV